MQVFPYANFIVFRAMEAPSLERAILEQRVAASADFFRYSITQFNSRFSHFAAVYLPSREESC